MAYLTWKTGPYFFAHFMQTVAWSVPSCRRLPTTGQPGISGRPGIRGCSDRKRSCTSAMQARRTAEATITKDMATAMDQARMEAVRSGTIADCGWLWMNSDVGLVVLGGIEDAASFICSVQCIQVASRHPWPQSAGTENCDSLGLSPSAKHPPADWRGFPCATVRTHRQ